MAFGRLRVRPPREQLAPQDGPLQKTERADLTGPKGQTVRWHGDYCNWPREGLCHALSLAAWAESFALVGGSALILLRREKAWQHRFVQRQRVRKHSECKQKPSI